MRETSNPLARKNLRVTGTYGLEVRLITAVRADAASANRQIVTIRKVHDFHVAIVGPKAYGGDWRVNGLES